MQILREDKTDGSSIPSIYGKYVYGKSEVLRTDNRIEFIDRDFDRSFFKERIKYEFIKKRDLPGWLC